MKTYAQLTSEQQASAVQHCLNRLLEHITEGGIRFNDTANSDDLQQRIDRAQAKAEQMQTPWFASSYIMDTCREDLESMAQSEAEDSMYAEQNEHVIHGIA